jgi:hypothetical protein
MLTVTTVASGKYFGLVDTGQGRIPAYRERTASSAVIAIIHGIPFRDLIIVEKRNRAHNTKTLLSGSQPSLHMRDTPVILYRVMAV